MYLYSLYVKSIFQGGVTSMQVDMADNKNFFQSLAFIIKFKTLNNFLPSRRARTEYQVDKLN